VLSGVATRARVDWPQTYRTIRSIFPPIELFEDIAVPADRKAVTASDVKVNEAVSASFGDLSRVPAARRVSVDGAFRPLLATAAGSVHRRQLGDLRRR
jgi:hypothetical protein